MQTGNLEDQKLVAKELKQIQKESFKVQQELLQLIEDAKKLKIPEYDNSKRINK
jgi:uncharacterized protein (DUF3084 family)